MAATKVTANRKERREHKERFAFALSAFFAVEKSCRQCAIRRDSTTERGRSPSAAFAICHLPSAICHSRAARSAPRAMSVQCPNMSQNLIEFATNCVRALNRGKTPGADRTSEPENLRGNNLIACGKFIPQFHPALPQNRLARR
jgi:hypothetical protein